MQFHRSKKLPNASEEFCAAKSVCKRWSFTELKKDGVLEQQKNLRSQLCSDIIALTKGDFSPRKLRAIINE